MRSNPINLLVGSKVEYYRYREWIWEDRHESARWITRLEQVPHYSAVVFVAGTGHLVPDYHDIVNFVKKTGGVVHYYATPGLVVAPALEIAHEFAEYLGIDPSWRYDGPQ